MVNTGSPGEMTDRHSSFLGFGIKPWGLFTAVGVVACVGTVFGFLGRFSWFLDLFSHFRVQYAMGLGLLGVLLAGGRRRRTAAVFLGFAFVNLAPVLPLYLDGSRVQADAATRLRAMLINVNKRLGDPDRVREAISAADPDILVLEEIDSRWMSELAWLTNSHPHALAQPREDNFGIGLFSKSRIVEGEVVHIGDAGVPSIVAIVATADSNLRVIATHPLPPAGRNYSHLRNDQLERLPDHVGSNLPVLLLGDLNVTPWNRHFRRLTDRTGLRDSARGFGVQPTWPGGFPFLRIPIDHCLHSEDILIVDRRIGSDVSSDHYPLIVDFVIGVEPR